MWSLRIAWVLVFGAFTALSACSSGQTGSPKCARPRSCICDVLQDQIMVFGTLEAFNEDRATVTVTGWPSEDAGHGDLDVGDEVGGAYQTTLGCSESAGSTPDVGDEVLVVYERGRLDRYPDCPEYIDCTESMCGAQPTEEMPGSAGASWDVCDGECVTTTREVCSERRDEALLDGELMLFSKMEPILWDGHTVSDEDLRVVHDLAFCENLFPPALGSCGSDEIDGCTFSGTTGKSTPWLLVLPGLLWAIRRNRSRRRSAV